MERRTSILSSPLENLGLKFTSPQFAYKDFGTKYLEENFSLRGVLYCTSLVVQKSILIFTTLFSSVVQNHWNSPMPLMSPPPPTGTKFPYFFFNLIFTGWSYGNVKWTGGPCHGQWPLGGFWLRGGVSMEKVGDQQCKLPCLLDGSGVDRAVLQRASWLTLQNTLIPKS